VLTEHLRQVIAVAVYEQEVQLLGQAMHYSSVFAAGLKKP
jgi:hypothetical protein